MVKWPELCTFYTYKYSDFERISNVFFVKKIILSSDKPLYIHYQLSKRNIMLIIN